MDFAEILGDAFTYARDGIVGNTNRWLKLILAVLCLGLPFNGYIVRVYRGATPAPEVDRWGELFVDGLKLVIVGIVYFIPVIVLWILIFGAMIYAGFSGSAESAVAATGANLLLMMLMYILEILIAVLLPVAYIRFARTGSFSEAFDFRAILETIGKIGWLNYIVAVILVSLVVGIPILVLVLGFILVGGIALFLALTMSENAILLFFGVLGLMLLVILIIAPVLGVFQARYMTRVYDSTSPAIAGP
jgi:hypothetical protein